jgi:pyruvate formate lyase activating enzyme
VGHCRGRANRAGKIVCENYGFVTGLALDPIEKKPLYHFFPGRFILSVGSYGCNLRCPFCQNSHIAMAGAEIRRSAKGGEVFSPAELVALAQGRRENIGLAYTYNEPLIGYEFVRDCARLANQAGLRNVLVTNGMICREPLLALLPDIHAMNIDLKGFTGRFYDWVGGSLETVKETIRLAAAACHVEVTTLIVPGENDSAAEIGELAGWLASVSPTIPLHITCFFPRWQLTDRPPTPVATVYRLARTARRYLRYVHEGNCF